MSAMVRRKIGWGRSRLGWAPSRAGGARGGVVKKHHRDPASPGVACPKCNAAPGVMCSGAARPKTYPYTMRKPRQQLAEMPQDRLEWDRRMDLVSAALGVPR